MSDTPGYADVEQALLRASGTVSAYSYKHNLDLPTIQLNLHGLQSIGKSRLLNAIARRALGFVKEGTGNKCPVQYQFKTASDEASERCQVTWRGAAETVDASDIYKKVQSVMESTEFTSDVLQVTVELVDAMTMCVVDMPGIRPANANNAQRDNPLIQGIWRTCAAVPSSIPIFVTQLHSDPDRMQDELESLKLAMNASPQALKQAIVVVTHLDKHSNETRCDRFMSNLQRICHEKGIGSKERTVFCSLKPENFNPASKKEADCEDLEVLHTYFRGILEHDAAMVKQYVPDELSANFKVGIQEVVRVMIDTVVVHFQMNASTMLSGLTNEFEGIEASARSATDREDVKKIRLEATQVVRLYCSYLAGLARWDISGVHETMQCCGPLAKQPSEVSLPKSIELTFDEEIGMYAVSTFEFVKVFRTLEPGIGHGLRVQLGRKLCGGSALLRLLRVWTYVVLKHSGGDYTADEMQRMGCMGDLNEKRGWSIEWCLKKMIGASSSFLSSTVNEIGTWARRLFSSHAQVASQVVPGILLALRGTPTLRMRIIDQLAEQYDQNLMNQVNKAVSATLDSIRSHFKSLNLNVPFLLLRLICSTEISDTLPTGNSRPNGAPHRDSIVRALSNVPGLDARIIATVSNWCAMQWNGPRAAVADLFRMCTCLSSLVTTEYFVLGEGMELPNVNDTELDEKGSTINQLARMFTYLHNGLALINATNAFDREVEQRVKQLDEVVRADLMRVLTKLSDDDLRAMIVDDVPQRLSAIKRLQKTLNENRDAQRDVLDACKLLGACLLSGTPAYEFDTATRNLTACETRLTALLPETGERHAARDLRDVMAEVSKAEVPELTPELVQERDAQIATLTRDLKASERALAARVSTETGNGEMRLRAQLADAVSRHDEAAAKVTELTSQVAVLQATLAEQTRTLEERDAREAELNEQIINLQAIIDSSPDLHANEHDVWFDWVRERIAA